MCPVFIGGTGRTCKGLSSYFDKETVKFPFEISFSNLRKNISQVSIEKVAAGYDNEIN